MTRSDRYRIFLEEALDALFVFDLDGKILDVNREACASLDYERHELLQMNVTHINPEFKPEMTRQTWTQLGPEGSVIGETTHKRRDGTLIPVEFHLCTGVVDGQSLIFALARDITERVLANKRQERLSKLYKTLSEINHAIIQADDQIALLCNICRIAVQFGGMQMAGVGELDGTRNTIDLVAGYGDSYDKIKNSSHWVSSAAEPDSTGISNRALRDNRHIIINDALNDPRTSGWKDYLEHIGSRSLATFPLQRGGASFAVLTVYHDNAGAFDSEMVALLDEIALDISFGLDNIAREQSRIEAMAKIQEQNNFLTAILDSEPECVKVVSRTGDLLQMNRAGLAMLEVDSVEEAQAHGLLNFITLSHRDLFIDLHNRVCNGSSGYLEFPIVGKKGTLRWLDAHATPLRNAAGEVDALLSVTRDITEKKHFDELLWNKANFDLLTGLPNRNMFYDRLELEMKRMHRAGQMLAVLFIDLDRFKEVNDTNGHHAGDELLIEAGKRISACVRASDTVARLGGDEFTVILPELADKTDIEALARTILSALAEPFQLIQRQTSAQISASIGITLYPSDGIVADQLMGNVDQAMYEAKNLGRNCYSFFVPALRERVTYKSALLADLRSALAGNQLSLNFQPIIDLATHRICKLEALLRWNHPKRGAVSPAEFIPLAEESGLIIEIGSWVFRQAVYWINRWIGMGFNDLLIGVNMSPLQLQGAMKTIDPYFDALQEFDVSGRNIIIEITEGVLLHAGNDSKNMLRRFREAGCSLAIDDFGTGYSALSYLKQFDVDYLKIDQSFVRDLVTDPSDMALSEAIIVMAHKLGLHVIAEGVETAEQKQLLIAAGCDAAQGYLFSKPVTAEIAEQLLLSNTCYL